MRSGSRLRNGLVFTTAACLMQHNVWQESMRDSKTLLSKTTVTVKLLNNNNSRISIQCLA